MFNELQSSSVTSLGLPFLKYILSFQRIIYKNGHLVDILFWLIESQILTIRLIWFAISASVMMYCCL